MNVITSFISLFRRTTQRRHLRRRLRLSHASSALIAEFLEERLLPSLIGLSGDYAFGDLSLVRFTDPVRGRMTPVGSSFDSFESRGVSALDPVNHRYYDVAYFPDNKDHLRVIDTRTGNVIASPVVPNMISLEFDSEAVDVEILSAMTPDSQHITYRLTNN